MYLLFGRRKLPRRISGWSGRREYATHWAEDLIESFGVAAAAGSRVAFHRDGHESRAGLIATMQSAAQRLDVCTYILGNDAFGHEITELMMGLCASGRTRPAAHRRRWARCRCRGKWLRRLQCLRHRDRHLQPAARAPDTRPAQPAQSSQMDDRGCRTAVGRWAQPRRRVLHRAEGRHAPGPIFRSISAVRPRWPRRINSRPTGPRPAARRQRPSPCPTGGTTAAVPNFCRAVRTSWRIRCMRC